MICGILRSIRARTDEKLNKRFLKADYPHEMKEKLRSFLEIVADPIAVRSSSLLEDSRYLPFAGIYFDLYAAE